MARIQILELPTIYRQDGHDETPFVLVIDQVEPERYILGVDQEPLPSQWEGLAEKVGARAILLFEDTVDIPANQVVSSREQIDQQIRQSWGELHRAHQHPA